MVFDVSRSSGPVSFGFSSLECTNALKSMGSLTDCPTSPALPMDTNQRDTSLKTELSTEVIHIHWYQCDIYLIPTMCENFRIKWFGKLI